MRATIYCQCPEGPDRLTEVEIDVNHFKSPTEKEEARRQLANCFGSIWKVHNTKVVFENEAGEEQENPKISYLIRHDSSKDVLQACK